MIIELKNFMSHKSSTVELPSTGLVVVVGPNGAGKSALVESVGIALWGKGSRALKWSPWRPEVKGHVVISDGDLVIERRWTGKSKTLQWRRLINGSCEDHDTTSKAQEALDAVVGPFDVWRRTCVFSSADAAHFTLASDAERKELLESLLGLGWFDRALTACRKDLNVARSELGKAERDRDLAVTRMEQLSKTLREASELLTSTADPGEVGLMRADLEVTVGHLKDVASEYQAIDREVNNLFGAGGEEKARAQQLQSKLKRLSEDECYTCGQEIPDSLRVELREEIASEVLAADGAKAAVAEKLAGLMSRRDELHEEAEGLRKIEARQREAITKKTSARDLRRRLEAAVQKQGQEMQDLADKVLAEADRVKSCTVDVAELEACERVLGVRGARAHLIGRTLVSIEDLANTWMMRLSSDVRIGLRPYTEKKSGGVTESISLQLQGAGGEAGYLGASAGERRRVDVALLMSLAELAGGNAAGQWQSPIFFDEVFDSLDVEGRDAVVEVIEEMSKTRCVVLVTHDESLASGRADLKLRVDAGVITSSD